MATLYPLSLEEQLRRDRMETEADKIARAIATATWQQLGVKDNDVACMTKEVLIGRLKTACRAGQDMSVQHQKPVPFGKKGRGQVEED